MLIAILNTTEFAQIKDSFDFYKSSHQRCSIKKAALKNFTILKGNHLCWSLFFNKAVGLQASNFIKKRLQNRRFTTVNIAKIFKRLLLFLWNQFLDLFKVEQQLLQNVLKSSFLKKCRKIPRKIPTTVSFYSQVTNLQLVTLPKTDCFVNVSLKFCKTFRKKKLFCRIPKNISCQM